MRVLIAPDKFAGTLTAPEAAAAIATGWARQAPDDVLDLAAMADGGPGFVGVLHSALGGDLVPVLVAGPFGEPVPAEVLVVGETAYVEAAQACGLSLTAGRAADTVDTAGVGDLVRAAVDRGVGTVVVGLGGSGTTDGGAGALAALGATCEGGRLRGGPLGLEGIRSVDLSAARAALVGTRLVAATDVDNPLTGLFGAARTFGPQKGLTPDQQLRVDALLTGYAAAVDTRLALQPGAGAAGGLGFALLALGAETRPGIELVAAAVDLHGRARLADLVVTGEGSFDVSSRGGKVPAGVAEVSQQALRPCVVLAGRVLVGSREMRTMGVESAYSMVDLVGEERSFADPAGTLAELAARVARTWSR